MRTSAAVVCWPWPTSNSESLPLLRRGRQSCAAGSKASRPDASPSYWSKWSRAESSIGTQSCQLRWTDVSKHPPEYFLDWRNDRRRRRSSNAGSRRRKQRVQASGGTLPTSLRRWPFAPEWPPVRSWETRASACPSFASRIQGGSRPLVSATRPITKAWAARARWWRELLLRSACLSWQVVQLSVVSSQ